MKNKLFLLLFAILPILFSGNCKPTPTTSEPENIPSINAPLNFLAKAISSNEIELTWSPSSGSEISYNIYKNNTKITSTNSLTYIDHFPLIEQQQYDYYVIAVDSKGRESDKSNVSTTSYFSGTMDNANTNKRYNISLPTDRELYFIITVDPNLSLHGVNSYSSTNLLENDGVTSLFNIFTPYGGNSTSTSDGPHGMKAGNYIINVNRVSGSGKYSFTVYSKQSTMVNDNEPNDAISSANSINLNNFYEGHLGYIGGGNGTTDNTDYYKLSLNTKSSVDFDCIVEPSLSLRDLNTYSPSGIFISDGVTLLSIIRLPASYRASPSESSKTDGPFSLDAGNYYIKIRLVSGYGGYKIKLRSR